MNEPCRNHDCPSDCCKVDRKLPPHELNARRNRKRAVTHLPGVVGLPEPRHRHHKEHVSPNDRVFNHATNPLHHQ